MEQWLSNPKSSQGSQGSRNVSIDYSTVSLRGLSAQNSTGFILSNDELDRLDVMMRHMKTTKLRRALRPKNHDPIRFNLQEVL